MTLAMATVGDIVSPRERGRYQGYIQTVFVLASVAGPLLGGLFVDHLSWRWAFYANLPIGAVALALLSAYLHLPAERRPGRIDFLGAGLLAAAVSSSLLVTVWAGDRYAWRSPQILGLATVALALFGAFVWQERRAPEPVLPLRLFRDRVLVVVSAALFIATLSLFAALVFMPLFLQIVTGTSATRSGLLLLSRLGATSSRGTAALFMVVFGLGFGMVTQVLVVAIQNAVDRREIGTASASANLFRAGDGSVGVASYGAVVAIGLRHWLPLTQPGRLPAGVDPHGIQASPGRIHAFPAAVQHGIAQAVASSLHDVFLTAAPIALAGFLVVLFLRERPLRGPSQARTGARPQGRPSEPSRT